MSKFKRTVKKVLPIGLDAKVSDISQKLDELNTKVGTIIGEFGSHDFRIDELKEKAKHVEPYQPIYGIHGILDNPKRDTQDRAEAIFAYYKGNISGLKILDIGSSLGYICFFLSDRGAFVNGWDMSEKNIEVARLIRDITGVKAEFSAKTLDNETVKTIKKYEFDAVILLNVFHHITHHKGIRYSQKLLHELLDRIPVVIVELALQGEDKEIFWDKAQPADELDILGKLRNEVDVVKIGDFNNHLSNNTRPMYAISRKKVIYVNNKPYTFYKQSAEAYLFSRAAIGNEKRRYYWAEKMLVKEYYFENGPTSTNAQLIINEISNLLKTRKVYRSPQLVDYELNNGCAKIILELIDGKIVGDYDKRTDKDVSIIIKDVLRSLSDLESLKLYHNDVRSWNIIYNNKNASLIDYGQVSATNYDNDLISLLWASDAIYNGGRESINMGKSSLPNINKLPASAKALYNLVSSGCSSSTEAYKRLYKNKKSIRQ